MQRSHIDMIAAGAGAGVAAGFGAPMSGVLFAVETMLLHPATSSPASKPISASSKQQPASPNALFRSQPRTPHGTAAAAAGSNDDDGGLQVRFGKCAWLKK